MNIGKLNTLNFPQQLKEILTEAINDKTVSVFQIIDSHGVIDRGKIHELLDGRNREVVDHVYTVIETGQPIVNTVEDHPGAIHLWYDASRNNVFHPEVMKALQSLSNGKMASRGTFVLVLDANDYADGYFPPFPGVHIDLPNDAFLDYLAANP